jgi:4-hydroxybenzoate polyprenyltransferase
MFIAGATIALTLPINFQFIFLLYWLVNLLYSFYLKQLFIVDVATLSLLYTLRIIAGAEAIYIETTTWLLGFSFALFFGLAIVKRVTELLNVISDGGYVIPGRAYNRNQLRMLSTAGIVSSAIAISIFALYISAPETTELYDSPLILWAILPLLICLFYRIWRSALTFKMNEDPVLFALTDRSGQLIVLVCGFLLWLAS